MRKTTSFTTTGNPTDVLSVLANALREEGAKLNYGGSRIEAKLGSALWYRCLGALTPPRLMPINAVFTVQKGSGEQQVQVAVDMTSREGPALYEAAAHRPATEGRMDQVLSVAVGATKRPPGQATGR